MHSSSTKRRAASHGDTYLPRGSKENYPSSVFLDERETAHMHMRLFKAVRMRFDHDHSIPSFASPTTATHVDRTARYPTTAAGNSPLASHILAHQPAV